MCREYQNLGISSRENTHTTQHDRTEKNSVCLAEKAKSSRLDVVHTHLDGMLSNKRSTEQASPDTRTCPSGRFTLEAEKQREICRTKIS